MSDLCSAIDDLEAGSLDLRDFREVLLSAEEAFLEAEAHAKKMRYAHLDTSQRKKIKDARPLVALLDDEGASPHEKSQRLPSRM